MMCLFESWGGRVQSKVSKYAQGFYVLLKAGEITTVLLTKGFCSCYVSEGGGEKEASVRKGSRDKVLN